MSSMPSSWRRASFSMMAWILGPTSFSGFILLGSSFVFTSGRGIAATGACSGRPMAKSTIELDETLFEDSQPDVDLVAPHDERRREPDGRRPAGDEQEALLKRELLERAHVFGGRRVRLGHEELRAVHAHAANVRHDRMPVLDRAKL